MVVIRNQLTSVRSGGRRQYSEVRNRLLLTIKENGGGGVIQKLEDLNMRPNLLDNAPVVIARPEETLKEVLEALSEEDETDSGVIDEAIQHLAEVAEQGRVISGPSQFTLRATDQLVNLVNSLNGVEDAEFVTNYADYGPENLRMSFGEIPTVDVDEADKISGNLEDVNQSLGLPDAWETTRGENVVVAIFDTGFSKGLISEDRIVGTYHGESVDSVYESKEGHGTMTAGAAAASKEDGAPFNGSAPGVGVILVRTTDSEGQISSDVISEAWDWLLNLNLDRPIITNHSYGTPICSGRPRTKFCDTPRNRLVNVANSRSNITSVYAAGNEAMTCGHRLIGFTNGITGTNSLSNVITVGALLTSGREAQKYSSHGRGDCSPVSDPKPNVSSAIPRITYYGSEDGWKLKDMSSGVVGSSGGTSHASPTIAGMVALIQSAAVDNMGRSLENEELKELIKNNSEPPRRTQVNSFGLVVGEKGYDARFGYGQLDINAALNEVTE